MLTGLGVILTETLIFGRENTQEEEAWAEERGCVSMVSWELKSRLKQDIYAGIWTPLGAGRET